MDVVVRAGKDASAHQRVAFHESPFRGIQRSRLLQDAVRQRELADVVHEGSMEEPVEIVAVPAQLFRNRHRIVGHAQHVPSGVVVLVLGRQSQAKHGVDGALAQTIESRLQVSRASLHP
jgi:hypothetical protein